MSDAWRVRKVRVPLGDMLAAVAKPVALAVDALTAHTASPTHLATCTPCANRRRALNALGGSDAREWPPADEAGLI